MSSKLWRVAGRLFPSKKNGEFRRRRSRLVRAGVERLEERAVLSTFDYSTYLGGSGIDGYGTFVAMDDAGNAYVAGSTSSANFPSQGSVYDSTYNGGSDLFVAKFTRTGQLVWSTLLGGASDDTCTDVVLDAAGNIYLTGKTTSSDFPTTTGAYKPVYGPNGYSYNGWGDAFVAVLGPSGDTLVYSTYFGGTVQDAGGAVAVGPGGLIYLTGLTGSPDFPTTAGAVQTTFGGGYNFGGFQYGDSFLVTLDPSQVGAAQLQYSTFLGGSGNEHGFGLAVDAVGDAYLTGYTTYYRSYPIKAFPTTAGAYRTTHAGGDADGYVTKITPQAGVPLVYSTYVGGAGYDFFSDIEVDAAGRAYVTGGTNSWNFPTTTGAFQTALRGPGDKFVTELNPTGSGLVYSTYFGGSGQDVIYIDHSFVVDADGAIWIGGQTPSADLPVTSDAVQLTFGGSWDAFLAKLNPSLVGAAQLVYGTYLGGAGDEFGYGLAVDRFGRATLAGMTTSTNFPVHDAYQASKSGANDAFVSRIATVANEAPSVDAGEDATVDEGAAWSQSGAFTDAIPDHWTGEVDYGDGTGAQSLAIAPDRTFVLDHVFAENGDYAVTVRIDDGEGGVGIDTVQVTVRNVAPTPTITTVAQPHPHFILQGDALQFSGSFTDPGTLDTHAIAWDFGDGGTAAGALAVAHAYAAPGVYDVTLTVTDDDGGATTVHRQVTVDTPAQATAKLIPVVQGLPNLRTAQTRPLVQSLQSAVTSINRSRDAAARAHLCTFQKQVLSLKRTGKIAGATADTLVEEAAAIAAVLRLRSSESR